MGAEAPLSARLGGLAGYDPHALHVEAAREALCRCVEAIAGEESIALCLAAGRVLAKPVVCALNVPPHHNAAMDGYALRSADLAPSGETRLILIGHAYAGHPFQGTIGPGECARVMTGAPLPAGADTVVMQEAVRTEGDHVHVPPGQKPRQHVRLAGEDLRAGETVLAPGRQLGPAELGLVASLGIGTIAVRPRLRVAHFSTGDEIASIGEPLASGQIYDANRYTLGALLARLGFEARDLGVVRDEPRELERALREAAADADAIVTSGGVSGGDADFVRPLAARLGEVLFWKLAMRPGRPFAFGRIGNAWLFGLPGNPVAAMVAFCQLVREPLLRLAGVHDPHAPPLFDARCTEPLRKQPGRTEFQRGVLSRGARGELEVCSTGDQGSGILRSMSQANCFIVLEHARGAVAAGDRVKVQLLEGLF